MRFAAVVPMNHTPRPNLTWRSGGLLSRSLLACLLGVLAGSLLAGSAGGQQYSLPTVPTTAPPPVGGPSLPLLSPFPVVRMSSSPSRRGARIKLLTVKVAVGTFIVTRCAGPAKRCPYKENIVQVRGPARATRTVHIRRFERSFRGGVVLRVFVASRTRTGKYTSFQIRRGGLPRRKDRCIIGADLRPVICPVR